MSDNAPIGKTPAKPASSRLEPRATPEIPDHELVRCIGRGSYGEVWLARSVMDAYRAVKIVYRETFEDDRPFEREFAGIQKFEPISRAHDSQVDILHVGKKEGYFFYVMELADDQQTGQQIDPAQYAPKTLRSEVFQRGRLSFEESLKISLTLTTALEHLHHHGLIHRDIKPSNIIFINGVPKLADIGLVARLDATQSFVGTEGFLPPEGPGTARADLYSLGKVIYEMITGKDRHEFPNPVTNLGELPDRKGLLELNEIVLTACEQDARRRYESAEEMHAELLLLQGGQSITHMRRLERRLALLTKVGTVTAICAVLATVGYLYQHEQTREVKRLASEEARQRQRAEGALDRLAIQMAEESLANDQAGSAVAQLARVLHDDPTGRFAAERLMALLSQRSFPLPEVGPLRHEDNIVHAEFSPDGRRLATASWDETARVWDALTGEPLTKPMKHDGLVLCARFSPDGQRVVTAGLDFTARVWDSSTGEPLTKPLRESEQRFSANTISELKRFHGEGKGSALDSAMSAQFSPDGERVITCSLAGTARIWNARTGELLVGPLQHSAGVVSAQFSPEGQRVVTASQDKTAAVWDAGTGQLLVTLVGHERELVSAQFSRDGLWIVTASLDKTARVWDAHTGQLLSGPLQHDDEVISAQFSPSGQRVLTTTRNQGAQIWDARTGQILIGSLRRGAAICSAQFGAEGLRVVTASEDHTARLWDALTGQPLTEPIKQSGRINAVRLSPDGQRVVTACADGTAWILSARTTRWLPPAALKFRETSLTSVDFSADGHLVIASMADRERQAWDVQSGRRFTNALAGVPLFRSSQLSPDGRFMLATSNDTLHVCETESGRRLTEPFRLEGKIISATFSPDGGWVATAAADNVPRIWELPLAPVPVPPWLPELAEAAVGLRLNEQRSSEAVSWEKLLDLKRQMRERSASDHYTRWAKWFFADSTSRTISPSSLISVREYVRAKAYQQTWQSVEEAAQLLPEALALAALAERIAFLNQAANPRETAEAAWYSRRAVELAPNEARVCFTRAVVLCFCRHLPEALTATDRALELDPANTHMWQQKGWILKELKEYERSYEAYSKTIEVAGGDPVAQASYFFSRCYLLILMGRLADADADFQSAKAIMAREQSAHLELIGLSSYTNAPLAEIWQPRPRDALAELCSGKGPFAGAEFSARGIIQLSSLPLRRTSPQYQHEVNGIKVSRRVHRIHLLHGSIGTATNGTYIGGFKVHFADGQEGEISMLFSIGLGGFRTNLPSAKVNFSVAAQRSEPRAEKNSGPEIHLYQSCWENTYPLAELESLDFISTMTEAAPFVIAIAVE